MADEFGDKVQIKSGIHLTRGSGAFEVTVGGTLVHSKLTKGHGKCNTEEELDAILHAVEEMLKAKA